MSETPEPTRSELEGWIATFIERRPNDRIIPTIRLALEALDRRAEFARLTAKVAEQAAEIAEVKDELANVLNDWNALVKAVAAPTHGGAIGHAKHLVAQISRQAAEIERLTKQLDAVCAIGDAEVENANINRRALNGTRERMARYRKQRDVLRAQLRAVEALRDELLAEIPDEVGSAKEAERKDLFVTAASCFASSNTKRMTVAKLTAILEAKG